LLTCLPFAWVYLLPNQLVDFANSVVSSLFFGSNFYWNYSLQQYGAESSLIKPFLHTWSLAVEEQYYIVFPLALLIIYKKCGRHLIPILSIGILISLLLAEWMTARDPSFSFYMLPTRFWELLMGGLLAIILDSSPQRSYSLILNRGMTCLGLILIIYSISCIDYNVVNHPGLITLLPVVGTIFIIWFADKKEGVTKVLSSKLFVNVGLISYALYLWHYPIFAFGRIMEPQASAWTRMLWMVLTLLMAIISYLAVERPCRQSHFITNKVFYTGIAFFLAIVVSFSINVLINDGYKKRWLNLDQFISASKKVWVKKNNKKCHIGSGDQRPALGLANSCHFKYGVDRREPFILVGDSHAASLADRIQALAKYNARDFIQVTSASCAHITGFELKGHCAERSKDLLSYLNKYEDPVVIYNSRLPRYIEGEKYLNPEGWAENNYRPAPPSWGKNKKPQLISELIKTLTDLTRISKKLVIVYPVPEQGFNIPHRLALTKPEITTKEGLPDYSTSYISFKIRTKATYGALDKINSPNIVRIYPEQVFCNKTNGRCSASEGEKIYFGSDNHVSPLGAFMIVREVSEGLGLYSPSPFKVTTNTD